MTRPTKASGDQRQRVSDELRQLKQMSKGLRTRAMRELLVRHANVVRHASEQRPAKPVPLPTKPTPIVSA